MPECKRCGSTQVVKSGTVRKKQRFLCKRCGCHFVEGDDRESDISIVLKALCTVFQALGTKQYREIGKHLKRDPALICRWMNAESRKYNRRERMASEFWNVNNLFGKLKRHGLETGVPALLVDNVIDDLYIAVIVQRREKQ